MMRGEAALKAKLAALEARMIAAAGPAESGGATEVARMMAATAPRDTGALAASVGVEGSSAVATAPYAVYAPPFAAAAAHTAEPAVVASMLAVYKAVVRGV
jgi:hypothetical protein